jgi:HlyD family secretion protein
VNIHRAVLALALVAGCRSEATNGAIEGVGTLELVEVDVSPMVPARVTKVWREEGDRVRAGDTLLTLTQSTVPSTIAVQQAGVATAEAQLRDLLAGPRTSEIAQADAQVRAAEAEAARAERDVERITGLAAKGTVSQQQLDAVRTIARTAAARRDAARDAARTVREGARPAAIAAARARVASARAALSGAQQTATDLVLTAPVAGTVLVRSSEPGEVVPAGAPAMIVGDPSRPVVRIFVDESKLPLIHVGDAATLTLDAFPGKKLTGKVVSLSERAEFTPRVALTRDERADLLFGVKVQVTDTSSMVKAGLPVTVRITPRPAK